MLLSGKNSLGQNISGIETAAQSIFGVHSKDLNITQALLSWFVQSHINIHLSMVQGNVKNDEELQVGFDRQSYVVLEQMKDNGFITKRSI